MSLFLKQMLVTKEDLQFIANTLMVPPQITPFGGTPKMIHAEKYKLWGGTELLFVDISANWAPLEPPQREEAFRNNPHVDSSIADMRVLETETKGRRYLFLILLGSAEY